MADKYHIRWMIRRDMAEVLDIERRSFEFPWFEEDFIRCLRTKNCIGMVAEAGEQIAGFMIYGLYKSRLDLWTFAVHPDFRGMGVGRAMIAKLEGKLSAQRRVRICTEVRERNLDAQLFFKAMGFVAINSIRGHYVDSDEDAIVFCYRHESLVEAVQ